MLFKLFYTFAKIGLFTFGGGYGMIAIVQDECVEKKKWISEDEFATVLTIGHAHWGVGLIAAAFSMAGHYIGAGLAIKNGSKIVRPTVILVLILLLVKVLSELLFPQFWA